MIAESDKRSREILRDNLLLYDNNFDTLRNV